MYFYGNAGRIPDVLKDDSIENFMHNTHLVITNGFFLRKILSTLFFPGKPSWLRSAVL